MRPRLPLQLHGPALLSPLLLALALPASGVASGTPSAVPAAVQEGRRTQDPPRPDLERLNLGRDGLAIEGWDPVAYFPEGGGKPRKGRKDLSLTHRGVTYRFADEAHRDAFRAHPDRYEPAYGGWCAYAMAKDDRVEIDPETFLIQDGELLLFYNAFFTNTRKKWEKEGAAELRAEADRLWRVHHPGPERDLSDWVLEDGLALGGHDPVLLAGKVSQVKAGEVGRSWTYKGVTYRFASEGTREAFRAAPWRYEPGLGGRDPRSVLTDTPLPGRVEHALLHDGVLWLFADAASREAFSADPNATLEALRARDVPRTR